MFERTITLWPLGLAVLLCACGGGGGPVASAPPPTGLPSPSPTATPGSNPPGLVSAQPFTTVHVVKSVVAEGPIVDVEQTDPGLPLDFRYDESSGKYLITLPGRPQGSLAVTFGNEVDSNNNVVTSAGILPGTSVRLINPSFAVQRIPLTYTTYGSWSTLTDRKTDDGRQIQDFGSFVYGIPTAPSDVPTSGRATYSAVLEGVAVFDSPEGGGGQSIVGPVRLDFDFANGGLTGHMAPFLSNNGFQPYEGALGTFTFAQTTHAVGSTVYSGAFTSSGLETPGGNFAGSFNGPQAAELMASFSAPFQTDMRLLYDGVDRVDHLVGTLSGVWFGKKD